MSDFHNTPKECMARKMGKCVWCAEMIRVGDRQITQSGRGEGGMYFSRFHPECRAAFEKMWQTDQHYMEDGHWAWEQSRGCCCERGRCQCKVKELPAGWGEVKQ